MVRNNIINAVAIIPKDEPQVCFSKMFSRSAVLPSTNWDLYD